MVNMLQAWQGPVDVKGIRYDSIKNVPGDAWSGSDALRIVLYPLAQKSDVASENKQMAVSGDAEYQITVKQYMTRKASADFDFMAKWNNDVPMPLRTMRGTVEKETRGMVYMKLHGAGQQEIRCLRCGKELTHPISRHYGIGPECMKKLGIVADIEDVESIKEQLVNVTWEGWIIKSSITQKEEVNDEER